MVLRTFVPEVFRAEFDSKMRFGCIAHGLMHYPGASGSAKWIQQCILFLRAASSVREAVGLS